MLDIKSQSQLADATAEMMRACAFATARAASTSMLQGMSFWSRMLHAPAPQTDARTEETPPQAPAVSPTDPAFASYRSASGHAVAQVIVA
jgi:hypothetical protein